MTRLETLAHLILASWLSLLDSVCVIVCIAITHCARLPQLERSLIRDPAIIKPLVECFEQARSIRTLPGIFDFTRHPSLEGDRFVTRSKVCSRSWPHYRKSSCCFASWRSDHVLSTDRTCLRLQAVIQLSCACVRRVDCKNMRAPCIRVYARTLYLEFGLLTFGVGGSCFAVGAAWNWILDAGGTCCGIRWAVCLLLERVKLRLGPLTEGGYWSCVKHRLVL